MHIDDYFYPYRESRTYVRRVKRQARPRTQVDLEFPDDRTWKKYGKPDTASPTRDAWRRANIDDFVQSLYRGVKAIKPSVLVGIAPFGIWRSGTPSGVRGLDAYGEIYADSRRWLAEGWLDYIAPQLYWQVGRRRGSLPRARHVVAHGEPTRPLRLAGALHLARLWRTRPVADWTRSPTQIQVLAPVERGDGGAAWPRALSSCARSSPTSDRLAHDARREMYRDRALVPAFPWLGATAPAAPVVRSTRADGAARFDVSVGRQRRVRWWLIQTRGARRRVDDHAPAGRATHGSPPARSVRPTPSEIAVTAIGLTGVASAATVIAP